MKDPKARRCGADLVERRTDVSQNAQRQLWWRLIRLVGRQHGIVDPWRSGYLDVAAQHVMHDSTAPNTSPRNSEAPLAIFGCAVKPGSEAIKTDDFDDGIDGRERTDLLLDGGQGAFSLHCRAAAYPASSDTAPPSLPGVIN